MTHTTHPTRHPARHLIVDRHPSVTAAMAGSRRIRMGVLAVLACLLAASQLYSHHVFWEEWKDTTSAQSHQQVGGLYVQLVACHVYLQPAVCCDTCVVSSACVAVAQRSKMSQSRISTSAVASPTTSIGSRTTRVIRRPRRKGVRLYSRRSSDTKNHSSRPRPEAGFETDHDCLEC
jgi:hypothetical protein